MCVLHRNTTFTLLSLIIDQLNHMARMRACGGGTVVIANIICTIKKI